MEEREEGRKEWKGETVRRENEKEKDTKIERRRGRGRERERAETEGRDRNMTNQHKTEQKRTE